MSHTTLKSPVPAEETSGQAISWVLKAYVRTGAATLALAGLAMLCAATGEERLHGQADPLFGLTNRAMLVLFGVAHLAFSGVLLVVRDLMNQGFISLWIGVNYLAYRMGMVWVKAAVPFPALRLVGWKLGIRPSSVEVCWGVAPTQADRGTNAFGAVAEDAEPGSPFFRARRKGAHLMKSPVPRLSAVSLGLTAFRVWLKPGWRVSPQVGKRA